MKPDRDDDLAREIRAHLELEAEERTANGVDPGEARYAARRAFGNVTRIREDARAVWTPLWTERVAQDLRYAVRMLARSPGFTATAVVTLALGIGANTAIFTVVNTVLLRPLPFPDSDRIVRIVDNVAPPDSPGGVPRRVPALALSELAAFASETTTLSHVGAQIPTIRTLTSRAEPVRLIGARVSPALLSMLHTPPLFGRVFEPNEDSPGADPVVILSHASWQRYFGGDPDVVGRRVDMDGVTHTIVGVMDRGFGFPDPQDQFWLPLVRSGPLMQVRLPLTARLNDGVALSSAVVEMNEIIPRLRGESRRRDSGGFTLVRLRDLMAAPVTLPLLVMTAAVSLVLLIACVNVANLLLARTTARQREMAMRLALGASRARLIQQALTESVLLTLVGAIGGVGLAFGGIALLRTLATTLPRRDLGSGVGIPRLDEITIDGSVLAVTFAASVLTGLIFGLLPALRGGRTRSPLIAAFRHGTASAASGFNLLRGNRVQGALVVGEIAMAMTLFVGGGLLIRSFVNLSRVNPGYDPKGVLTFQISLPPGLPDTRLRAIAQDLVDRVQSLPGVKAVGYAESLPMTRVSARFVPLRKTPESGDQRPPRGPITPDRPDTRFVSRDFLAAMGIPVVAGRTFANTDRSGEPQVLVINRTLARSGLLGSNPIGSQIYTLGSQPWEVIGIVEDVRQSSLTEPATPQLFIDYRQVPEDEPIAGIGLYCSIRADRKSPILASAIPTLVSQIDPQTMVENIAAMDQLVSNSISRPRLYASLLGIFAGVAIVLAMTGIYGVMAYSVTRRAREIGIRMALGASRGRVFGLVLGQAAAVTLIGMALGLGGAVALTRYLDQLLFGLTALDPATFIGVALLFGAVATVAAFVPAHHATKVDPLTTLRVE
jgi:putative ABC transport system permease protein